MEYYYIATSSLNINNILSTESISPENFYRNRNFGYKRFNTVAPNPFANSLIAFNKPPYFEIEESDFDDYPIILEISKELIADDIICNNYNKNGVIVLQIQGTIYLHPNKVRFLFFNEAGLKTCIIKTEPSIETKLLPVYSSKFQLIDKASSFIWNKTLLSDVNDSLGENELMRIEIDSKINRIKGFYYSYYTGTILSTSLKPTSFKEEFHFLINSLVNSKKKKDKLAFRECIDKLNHFKTEVDNSVGTKSVAIEDLIEALYLENSGIKERGKLIEFLKSTQVGNYNFYSQLQWSIEEKKIRNHINLLIDNIIESISEVFSEEIVLIKEKRISNYLSNLKESEKKMIEPQVITKNISFNAHKLTHISDDIFVKRGSELYQHIINELLDYPISDGQDFLEQRVEIAFKLGQILKEFIEKWDESKEREYLNKLLDNIENYAPFEINSHSSLILQSVAVFILKGEDADKLIQAINQNQLRDYRLALGLWGAIFGFSALPKTITDKLFTEKNITNTLIFNADVQKKIHNNDSKELIRISTIAEQTKNKAYEDTFQKPKKDNVRDEKREYKKQTIIETNEFPKCPECGADMRIRKGKYDNEFLGCTRFPDCKGTRQLKDLPLKKESGDKLAKSIMDYIEEHGHSKIQDIIPLINERIGIKYSVTHIESYIRDFLSAYLELEKLDRAKGVRKRKKGNATQGTLL